MTTVYPPITNSCACLTLNRHISSPNPRSLALRPSLLRSVVREKAERRALRPERGEFAMSETVAELAEPAHPRNLTGECKTKIL